MIAAIYYSSFQSSYLWLPLAGLIVGMAASLTGSGGGFFFLPVLLLLFHIPMQIAVATALAATLPICLIGSWGHYHLGHMDLRMAAIFALAGITGAIAGTFSTRVLNTGTLKTAFGIYSVLIAIPIILHNRKRKINERRGEPLPAYSRGKQITRGSAYGFIAGIVTGTFGTSGAAPVLAGLLAMRLPIKLVIGTSLLIVLINTFSAMSAHLLLGEIDLTLVTFLAAGSIIGAIIGPRLLARFSTRRLETPARDWYAAVMIALGILIICSQ